MKKAFTIVEILIVIAIAGILAAILLPVACDSEHKSFMESCRAVDKTESQCEYEWKLAKAGRSVTVYN